MNVALTSTESSAAPHRKLALVRVTYIHPSDGETIDLILNWNRYEDRKRAMNLQTWAAHTMVEVRFRPFPAKS